MNFLNEDWSAESKPLIKGPGPDSSDIISQPCCRCGKVVQHVKGISSSHHCIKETNPDGHSTRCHR